MISLFGNKNEVSDTQRELEEYMKKRSQDNSGMNFNGYYSPDSFTGNTPQQGYAQSDSQAEYRNKTEKMLRQVPFGNQKYPLRAVQKT